MTTHSGESVEETPAPTPHWTSDVSGLPHEPPPEVNATITAVSVEGGPESSSDSLFVEPLWQLMGCVVLLAVVLGHRRKHRGR